MARISSTPVFVGDGDRKAIVGFVETFEAWTDPNGRNMPGYVGITVLGGRGEDGKKHVKAKNGRCTFSTDRAPAFLAALTEALES
jgi:hypothetical protein